MSAERGGTPVVTSDTPSPDPAVWMSAFETMCLIREFEEQSIEVYLRGEMPGLVHASSGQEAVPTGVCMHLETDDLVTSNHRGHGHCIAKGVDIRRMAAEVLGKAEGTCGGKGGSMHIADLSKGILGANGIVAGGIAMATGAAFSAKYRKSPQVSVVFVGDGTMNEGITFESFNLASLWQLPVVFVCENNQFTEYTRMELLTAGSLEGRAQAFSIPTAKVDGQDVRAVSHVAAEAVERARSGGGPTFIQADTHRYHGHHVGEIESGYRDSTEDAQWKERDPLAVLGTYLVKNDHANEAGLDEIRSKAAATVDEAYRWAKSGTEPALDQVSTHVFAKARA